MYICIYVHYNIREQLLFKTNWVMGARLKQLSEGGRGSVTLIGHLLKIADKVKTTHLSSNTEEQ